MSSGLRVGALVDPGPVPRWQRTLLEAVAALPHVTLSAWAPDEPPGTGAGREPSPLFRRYERWDRARFASADDPLARVEAPELETADGAPAVVLWLSERALPQRAPDGVALWFVRQGAARTEAEAPLLAEVSAGQGTVVTSLCSLEGERERVLRSGVGPSDPVSLHRSRVRAYARAALLPGRELAGAAPGHGPAPESPRSRPSGRATLALLARVARRLAARRLEARRHETRWLVALRRLEAGEQPLSLAGGYRTLLPPSGRAYADPFPLGDRLLFEDYPPGGRGHIAAVSLPDPGEPEPVLERDTHLSYPFLLRDGDDVLMVPESREAGRVELLRARDFPRGWETERVLFDGLPASDATLFEHEGRWWMFCSLSPDGEAAVDELHVFSAPGLDGEWTPHPANPVVCDVRSARPGGALFRHEGRLLRPAQDCSRAYGWRLVLNRVDVLDAESYRETPVAHIEPADRSITRVHTYNARDGWEALDAMWRAPRGAGGDGPETVRFDLVRYLAWHM